MASWSHAQVVAEPVARPRSQPRPRPRTAARTRSRARARGGIAWIAVCGILLAGVVFVNVAVLRLNLSLDSANAERTKLRAENAALGGDLSAELASPRIQSRARLELGLVPAGPSTYINIGK